MSIRDDLFVSEVIAGRGGAKVMTSIVDSITVCCKNRKNQKKISIFVKNYEILKESENSYVLDKFSLSGAFD